MVILGNITTNTMWLLIPFIVTLSLGWGSAVTTRLTLLMDHFGRGSFGAVLGFMSGIMMLGSMTGAPLAGLIFDTFSSYQGAWLGYSALTAIAVILAFTIPSPGSTMRTSEGLKTG
jgi:MFS family permease